MLKINELQKIYRTSKKGLKCATFQISEGEVVCLAGPNGSGKTTLLNTILGILKKDRGTISLFDKEVDNKNVKDKLAYVSDEIVLIEELTGSEYLSFIKSMSKDVFNSQISILLNIFDLKNDMDNLISSYSHGMKKKLQIISIIIRNFDVLILDEPCRGLDVEAVYILKKLIDEFKKKRKMILITSHDLLFVETICDRILIMTSGEIVENGTPEYLKSRYGKEKIEEAFLEAAFLKERGEKIDSLLENYFNVN
jgi:ABC-2 type transport system ATP-binding protein